MKDQVRVLGIDDAPFLFSDEQVPIVGAVLRSPSYLEGVMRSEVAVDGDDATQVIIDMVQASRYRQQIKLILIDGIALGGFNMVDIDRIAASLHVAVATVTRDRPDMAELESALSKHFSDWEKRMELLTRHPLYELPTDHRPIFVSSVGIELDELERMVRRCTVRGAIPEPLRVAHLIATAYVKGESQGRA